MSAAVAVTSTCRQWAAASPNAKALCRKAALAALAAPAINATDALDEVELAVVLADDKALRDLNRRFRGIDKPTNVLAFPAFEDGAPEMPSAMLGDVIVAFETAAKEAAAEGKALSDHLAHLVVHGVLHLRGYDHHKLGEAEAMEALETKILAGLGVADPYGEGAR